MFSRRRWLGVKEVRGMSASQAWKNFQLGEELHVAGSFIYNGLRRFHELRCLDHADELFEVLYNLSIGLERLLKIAIVLLEHDDSADQNALEQSLITHSHMELVARLGKHAELAFSGPQNDLLQLLTGFYKSLRYDRFSLSSVYKGKRESAAIRGLLSKYLSVEFPEGKDWIFGHFNEEQYRSFISRTVLKISRTLYQIIGKRSSELGLYTYELRHGSKAQSVFLREVKIADEDVLWKELLIFFMNSEPKGRYMAFLKDIESLRFDPALVGDYLDCFKSDAAKAEVMDELEAYYDEMEPNARKERFSIMQLIGASSVSFDEPEDGV